MSSRQRFAVWSAPYGPRLFRLRRTEPAKRSRPMRVTVADASALRAARTCEKLRSSSRVAATARTQECREVSETTHTLSTLGTKRRRTTSSSLSALLISQLRKAATKRRPTLAQQARAVDAEHMRPVLDELQPRKGPAFPGNPRVVVCSPRTAPTGQSELTSGPQGCKPQPPRSGVSAWPTGVVGFESHGISAIHESDSGPCAPHQVRRMRGKSACVQIGSIHALE